MMIFLFHFVQAVLSLVSCPVLFFEPCLLGSIHFVFRQVCLFYCKSFKSGLVVHVLIDVPVMVLRGLSSVVLSCLYLLLQSVPTFFLLFQTLTSPPLFDFHLRPVV